MKVKTNFIKGEMSQRVREKNQKRIKNPMNKFLGWNEYFIVQK